MKLQVQLEPGEEVLLRARRHWATFWPQLAALLVAGALPAGFLLGMLHRAGGANELLWRAALVLAVAWVGFWLLRVARHRRGYERTLLAVTNRRVIAVDAAPGRPARVTAIGLADLRDVSTVVDGAAATAFGFGDVVLIGRGSEQRLTVGGVAAPGRIAMQLCEARERNVVDAGLTERATVAARRG